MGKASSNKKVARAAKAGGGTSRRQTSTSWGYYGSIAGICVVGVALIIGSIIGRSIRETPPYSSASKKVASAQKAYDRLAGDKKADPKAVAAAAKKLAALKSDTHWHSAYAIWDCDAYLPAINANSVPDPDGIHAHDDGLIHVHPFTDRVAGDKARLGVFFDALGIKVEKSGITYPTSPDGTKKTKLEAGKKCKNGKPAVVSVVRWKSTKDTEPQRFTGDYRSLLIGKEQAWAFVLAPEGFIPPMPKTIEALANPVDVAGATPTTVAGATTATTVAGATTTLAGITTNISGAPTASTVAPTTAAPTTAAPATTTGATTTAAR